MIINNFNSDQEIIKELAQRIQRQRINMQLTQAQLAEKAGVSLKTIANLEKGMDVKFSIFMKVLRAENLLENINLLVPEILPSPYDYLKLEKQRQRVRVSEKSTSDNWKWGDEK